MEKQSAAIEVSRISKKRIGKQPVKPECASASSQASSSAGSSLASSRVSTPSISHSNTNNSSTTASSSNSCAALTVSENRMKFQYSREELLKLRNSPHAKEKPKSLPAGLEIYCEDGSWDPDLWISSISSNSGDLSVQSVPVREKRKTQPDSDIIANKRPSGITSKQTSDNGNSPDDDEHIILGPQRGSFNTGCQVKRTTTTADANQKRDGRGDRKDQRIGSGRIQISDRLSDRDTRLSDRGNPDRDRERDRDQRDRDRDRDRDREDVKGFDRRRPDRDQDDGRIRFTRNADDPFSGRFGRDDGHRNSNNERERRDDGSSSKGRFDREKDTTVDRVYERRNNVSGKSRLDYPDRRDYDDRRGISKPSGRYPRDSYSEHYNRSQAEPEWFTDGPKHQSETIELGGFDGPSKRESSDFRRSPVDDEERDRVSSSRESASSVSGDRKSKANLKPEEPDKIAKQKKEPEKGGKTAKQNSSTKTDHEAEGRSQLVNAGPSEVGENVQNGFSMVSGDSSRNEDQPSHSVGEFDINAFLKDDTMWLDPSTPTDPKAGSRFKQWFAQVNPTAESHLSPNNSAANGVTSSSPVFSLFGRDQSPSKNILNILHKPEKETPELPSIFLRLAPHDQTQSPADADVSANVKALMNSVAVPVGPMVLPTSGKILKAEDLEASLLIPPDGRQKNSSSSVGAESTPSNQVNPIIHSSQRAPLSIGPLFGPADSFGVDSALSSQVFHNSQAHVTRRAPPSIDLLFDPAYGNKPPGPAPALPAGARVTTLEELEAGLRDVHVAPPNCDQIPERNSQQDLSAFKKLLVLVKPDDMPTEPASGPVRQADVVQPQVHHGQALNISSSWMQKTPAGESNAVVELGGIPKHSVVQPPVQQPRLPQPSVPIQNFFNQHSHDSMHPLQPQLINFNRPPIMSANNQPLPVQMNAMMHNPMTQQPSMSPQMLQQCSPHASSPIMFGTQPPLNITAPMPIHSRQRPPPNLVNAMPAQLSHGLPQPPPQDATQYLHMLSQMDEQRRLQMMPPPGERPGLPHMAPNTAVGNQQSSGLNSSISSIPTAVIRKLASMRADEKISKDSQLTGDASIGSVARPPTSNRNPTAGAMHGDGSAMQGGLPGSADVLLRGKSIGVATHNGPVGISFGGMPDAGAVLQGFGQVGSNGSDVAEQNKNGRRLVGQGLMYQGPTGMEIIQQQQQLQQLQQQQLQQQQLQQQQLQQQQLQQQPVGGTIAGLPQTMGASGGRPIVKHDHQMPFGFVNRAPSRTPLTAEQLQVLNPRMLMPQQRTSVSIQQPVASEGMVGKLPAQLDPQQQQFAAALLLQLQRASQQPGSVASAGTIQTRPVMKPNGGSDQLARWFGPDVYGDRRLPNMPGQRVMTVDEIECAPAPTAN